MLETNIICPEYLILLSDYLFPLKQETVSSITERCFTLISCLQISVSHADLNASFREDIN